MTRRCDRGSLRFVTNEELLAAIDRRFDENDRRFEEFRRHVDVRFEDVDQRFDRVMEALAFVDAKIERYREETNRRLDEFRPFS